MELSDYRQLVISQPCPKGSGSPHIAGRIELRREIEVFKTPDDSYMFNDGETDYRRGQFRTNTYVTSFCIICGQIISCTKYLSEVRDGAIYPVVNKPTGWKSVFSRFF